MWRSLIALQCFLLGGESLHKRACGNIFKVRCRNGDCVPHEWLCDGDDDCGDRSDEEKCAEMEANALRSNCANGTGKYKLHHGCDGIVDCADGSDETQCWHTSCSSRSKHERCFHGACTTDPDTCCATQEGICVRPHSDARTLVAKKMLVFADGRDLYSLNFTDDVIRRLHRQDKVNITALTHCAATHMIFWIAGQSIWNTTLTTEEGEGTPYGHIEMSSPVLTMAYDWLQGNFYLALGDPSLVICHRRAETTEMLCSMPIKVSSRRVEWLAVRPIAGRLYVGSFTRPGLEIAVAEGDGGNARSIYTTRNGERSHIQLSGNGTEIFILRTDGEGTLSVVSALHDLERQITRNISEANTAPLALFNDLAILRVRNEVQALMFWNKTTVTRKKLNIPRTSRLFTLIDTEMQLKGENRCYNHTCDHLCVVIPRRAVCECDARYELMKDRQTCVSRNEDGKGDDDQTKLERTTSAEESDKNFELDQTTITEESDENFELDPTTSTEKSDKYSEVDRGAISEIIFDKIITAVIGAAGCLVIIGFYLFVREKLCKARTVPPKMSASVNLGSETSPITLEW